MTTRLTDMNAPAIEGGKPVRESFLIYGRPDIREPEIQEIVETLRGGWIGTGPRVSRFEADFRTYKDVAGAVAVNSCTAALHLSILALGIRPGDEVITTPMTFCASTNAILHAGAVPVFADCEPETMNIDPTRIEALITTKTKAILLVHFGGRPAAMDAILEIAGRRNIKVIEDCAHAIETEYHGRKAGTMGEMGCFSFYVTKNVVTAEGGMIITADRQLEERVKMLALHGLSKDAWKRFSDQGYKHYDVLEAGFKYNMTDLQAALGIHQLARVEANWTRRQHIWQRYTEAFQGLPCRTPLSPEEGTRHAYHLYPLLLEVETLSVGRDGLLDAFIKENIGVGVHYISLHHHPFYQEAVKNGKDQFPNAEWISERTISLPLSSALSDADVNDVITATTKLLTYYRKDS